MSDEIDSTKSADARRTMVDTQIRPSDVTRSDLIDAMLAVPRDAFFPKTRRALAHVGQDVEVADGRYELDPRVAAKLIMAADPGPRDLVLVVGSATGYMPAVMARLSQAVVALEASDELFSAASDVLSRMGVDTAITAKGLLEAGCAEHGPYDVILINGGVEIDAPDALLNQLADGGRLVSIRMSGPVGRCEIVTRSDGGFGARPAFDATAPVLPGFAAAAEFKF